MFVSVTCGYQIGLVALRATVGAIGTSHATTWPGERRDRDEPANEQDIHDDEEPAEPFWSTALEEQGDEHGKQGVKNSGR